VNVTMKLRVPLNKGILTTRVTSRFLRNSSLDSEYKVLSGTAHHIIKKTISQLLVSHS
jgi:hypothetical protein